MPQLALQHVNQVEHPGVKAELRPRHVSQVEHHRPHVSRVGPALRVSRRDYRTVSRAFLLSHPDLVQTEPPAIVAAAQEGAVGIAAAEAIVGVQEEVDLVVAVVPEAAVAEDDKQNRFSYDLKAIDPTPIGLSCKKNG